MFRKCSSYLSHVIRKPVYAICEQQRCRPAYAFAQSDQRRCCSLPRQSNTTSFYIQNFKPLASFCGWAGRFESYLVEKPQDRFYHDVAQFIYSRLLNFTEATDNTVTEIIRLYSLPPLQVHSTQTQWDNPFIHSCEWVSIRFGIHKSHSHSSDPQKLSERWVKSTPPSSVTHLFGLFISLKFCFKKCIILGG